MSGDGAEPDVGTIEGWGQLRPGERPVGLPVGLAWPCRVDPTGVDGPTRAQARDRAGDRAGWGLYVPADCAASVEQRIVEAARGCPRTAG